MARLTLANDYVMVYDDFLPKEAFESLLPYANAESFWIGHQAYWRKPWRMGDGMPVDGLSTVYRDDPALYLPTEARYPTSTALDAFIDAVNGIASEASPLVGERGTAWTGISFKTFIHPSGSGLSLHRDRHEYTGSYAFYVHHDWNFQWGGHLLVFDPRKYGRADRDYLEPKHSFFSDEDENEVVSEPGLALCVLPKPNRLVFIAPNTYHMITRVDARAGDRARITFAGFFISPSRGKS